MYLYLNNRNLGSTDYTSPTSQPIAILNQYFGPVFEISTKTLVITFLPILIFLYFNVAMTITVGVLLLVFIVVDTTLF